MGRAFTIALIVALAIVTLWWQLAEKRARALEKDRARAVAVADSIAKAARAVPESGAGTEETAPADRDSEQELERLRGLGLSNPAEQIRASLASHPELIPFEGVHGGTMFFDTTSVRLAGGRAYAAFEDGHIRGQGTFAYEVEHGRITWKRVTAKLD